MRGEKEGMCRNQLMLISDCVVIVPVATITFLFYTARTKGFFQNLCMPKGLKNAKVLVVEEHKR